MAVEYIMLGLAAEAAQRKKDNKLNIGKAQNYINALGYNQDRQAELSTMNIDELEHVLGHELDLSRYSHYRNYQTDPDVIFYARHDAIREIAEKEGWRYYDQTELNADPTYRKLVGMKRNPTNRPDRVLLRRPDIEPAHIFEWQDGWDLVKKLFKIWIVIMIILWGFVWLENIYLKCIGIL